MLYFIFNDKGKVILSFVIFIKYLNYNFHFTLHIHHILYMINFRNLKKKKEKK